MDAKYMDSHILIPKCVYKEFVNADNFYYKYSINAKKITKGYPKKTYTKKDYYSEAMEKALNRHIETPLKDLLDFARELPQKSNPFIVSSKIKEIALIYAKSLVARSELLIKYVTEDNDILKIATIQDQHDMVVDFAMKNKKTNMLYDMFDISFMVNETEIPFVLPTRGQYEYTIKGFLCINIPLTPYCSLWLKQRGKTIRQIKDGEEEIALIPKEQSDTVLQLNKYAFIRQSQDGLGYVVCDKIEILQNISNN